VLLLLLAWGAAGATLNVAVAWGLATKSVEGVPHVVELTAIHRKETAIRYQRVGSILYLGASLPSQFWAKLRIETLPAGNLDHPLFNPGKADDQLLDGKAMYVAAGWPCHALHGNSWIGNALPSAYSGQVRHALRTSRTDRTTLQWPKKKGEAAFRFTGQTLPGTGYLTQRVDIPFPTHPLWPGFAINTLFYAGVLWMLCCGPFALRRMIHRRRGRCAQCGYPIGQSPVCTECGAAVTPKAANA